MKLSCRARYTRHCHWDSHAMGCSRKEQRASNTRQQPHWAVWLLYRGPDTSASPSNGILEVAISHSTIPKLEGDKQESQHSSHHVVLPSNSGHSWAMPTANSCLCVRLNLAFFHSSTAILLDICPLMGISPGRDRHTCIFHRASCRGS